MLIEMLLELRERHNIPYYIFQPPEYIYMRYIITKQHNVSGKSPTSDPLIQSLTLYHRITALLTQVLIYPAYFAKMPTSVGILSFMSSINCMLKLDEHEQSLMTLRPGLEVIKLEFILRLKKAQ